MFRAYSAHFAGQFGPAYSLDLISMDAQQESHVLGCLHIFLTLIVVEYRILCEDVGELRQLVLLYIRKHLLADHVDIFVFSAFVLVRRSVRSHECRDHVHVMTFIEFVYDFQHLDLVRKVKAVAALCLSCSNAESHHFIQESRCLIQEFLFAGLSGVPYGIQDAAAGPEDVQISGALQLKWNFILSITAENHVGMPVYETRRNQPAFGIDHFIGLACRQFTIRCDLFNKAVLYENSRVFQFLIFTLLTALMAVTSEGSLQDAYILD